MTNFPFVVVTTACLLVISAWVSGFLKGGADLAVWARNRSANRIFKGTATSNRGNRPEAGLRAGVGPRASSRGCTTREQLINADRGCGSATSCLESSDGILLITNTGLRRRCCRPRTGDLRQTVSIILFA